MSDPFTPEAYLLYTSIYSADWFYPLEVCLYNFIDIYFTTYILNNKENMSNTVVMKSILRWDKEKYFQFLVCTFYWRVVW